MHKFQVTGNEYLSLPTIRETDGAIQGVTFLVMQLKGMLEIRGDDALIAPYLHVNGSPAALAPVWTRDGFWVPRFDAASAGVALRCTYLTPMAERAFCLRLTVQNTTDGALHVRFGTHGRWDQTLHEINESMALPLGREVKASAWNNAFVWRQNPGTPLFAFAPVVSDRQPFSEFDQQAQCRWEGFAYDLYRETALAAGEAVTLDLFFGIGYEEVAAATSAKELLRQGFDALHARTLSWLAAREKRVKDPAMDTLLNTNLFFALFYASGRSLDTEELCLMTSRSPRYYVSAAYWDRDSLLWAFPAMLLADADYARDILTYVFTRQARHFGVHSRYIDGTVLEPGFELDELCAPVIALHRYTQTTGDRSFAAQPYVQEALRALLRTLTAKKHPEIALYETFLQPTDDLRRYPYLTYDNVLVWHALRILADLLDMPELRARAEETRAAIMAHCVRAEGEGDFFVWSTDGKGRYDVYDEPPGSLQLLPFYGFCAQSDATWQRTVAKIRDEAYPLSFAGKPIAEIGCLHAPHPWVLSICNSLLSGHAQSALAHLRLTQMDNGVACESIHEVTGECETGEAFATCAGFLAYALHTALTQEHVQAKP